MIRLESFAKINLFLRVFGRRPDGFHEIESVMQTVALADRITIEAAEGVEVTADVPDVPDGERNIAFRAARLLQSAAGTHEGCRIHIEKKIPAAAGLGGGSGNAAATVAGLCKLWKIDPPEEDLLALGAELGSDVPFFFFGGTRLCRGRGERVEPLPPIPEETRFLLVTPAIHLSTALIYKEFDRRRLTRKGAPSKLISVPDPVPDGGRLLRCLFNELEEWVLQAYPPVRAAHGLMKHLCPSGVLLSGTGPTLFGIVSAEKTDGVGIVPLFADGRLATIVPPTSSGYHFLH